MEDLRGYTSLMQVISDLQRTSLAQMQDELRLAGWVQISRYLWRSPLGELKLMYAAWKRIPKA